MGVIFSDISLVFSGAHRISLSFLTLQYVLTFETLLLRLQDLKYDQT